MILLTGKTGLLGGALAKILPSGTFAPPRKILDLGKSWDLTSYHIDLAFLCAGTKGHAECEGNVEAFRADVDGNIKLARELLSRNAFVVFVSTDAVERMPGAYARNRFFVELAIGGLPNVAIFRPGRFTESNVYLVAQALASIGLKRQGGLHRWP